MCILIPFISMFSYCRLVKISARRILRRKPDERHASHPWLQTKSQSDPSHYTTTRRRFALQDFCYRFLNNPVSSAFYALQIKIKAVEEFFLHISIQRMQLVDIPHRSHGGFSAAWWSASSQDGESTEKRVHRYVGGAAVPTGRKISLTLRRAKRAPKEIS